MHKLFLALCMTLLPMAGLAQQRDSHFDNYASYDAFLNDHMMRRDFVPVIQTLGGRDEYTPEQLAGINSRFLSIYPADFTDAAVIRQTDLGGGFRQEARVYWSDTAGYVYFFAMLHDRADALVVLTFTINSDVSAVMQEF